MTVAYYTMLALALPTAALIIAFLLHRFYEGRRRQLEVADRLATGNPYLYADHSPWSDWSTPHQAAKP
jgi:hypothetical protein